MITVAVIISVSHMPPASSEAPSQKHAAMYPTALSPNMTLRLFIVVECLLRSLQ